MRLSAGIESLAGLDPALRQELFGETWPDVWGMRNRIAHGYLLVEPGVEPILEPGAVVRMGQALAQRGSAAHRHMSKYRLGACSAARRRCEQRLNGRRIGCHIDGWIEGFLQL